jgi:hypothetical protein
MTIPICLEFSPPATDPANRRFFKLLSLFHFANFFLQRVAVRKCENDWILLLFHRRFGFAAIHQTIRRQERELPDSDFATGAYDFADRGRVGDASDLQLGDVLVTPKPYSF